MRTSILNTRRLEVMLIFVLIASSFNSIGQKASNSILVNFGRQTCAGSTTGSDITLFDAAQSVSPGLLLQCNTTTALGNIFSKFISYNAINNKLYINNITGGINSKIYILDAGLPSSVTCPVISGVSYTISNVVLAQFEFDPLGDLYALSGYNLALGKASIGAYDDTSGLLKTGSLKTLYFPVGHFPADLGNGDIAILPNGRMFCVFGGDTSKLFEITNYKKTDVGNAVTTFLGSPSKVCYGMAFDNGFLYMGGKTGTTCYAFTYNLTTNVLSGQITTPLGSRPVDYASFTPSIGAGLKIVGSVQVDPTHYDLTYQVYLSNLGNVKIGNTQVTDNLAALFSAGSISNITTSFISNGAGLVLNPLFNGWTDINLLSASQTLDNYPTARTNSTIQIVLRVANSVPFQIYNSSVKMSGQIGAGASLLLVSDSSNNYASSFSSWATVADPNVNSVADDAGEGMPTPWSMGMILPIELSTFNVQPHNAGASLSWTTLSEISNQYFAIERSNDATHFDSIGAVSGSGTSTLKHDYSFFDNKLPKRTSYYRLRQVDLNGSRSYSEIRVIEGPPEDVKYSIYPNPASDHLIFESSRITENDVSVDISSLYGKNILSKSISGTTLREQISLPELPNGYYILTIKNSDGVASFFKISINN
jgi:hypothetical protein